jgi:WD40 repeat protein
MVITILAAVASPLFAEAPAKVTFEDHIKPIFRNHCAKCHNPEEKNSDLDVMTFSSLIAGGASGQVVTGGDPDASRLFKLIAHTEEPKMPPESGKIPDAEIELVKAWIAGGLLDKSDSKAMLSARPKANIALAGAAVDKPTGPVAMPTDLLLEPVLHLERGFAVSSIASSPWAPVIAVAAPKQVLLFHADTNELVGVLPFPEGFPQVLKFSRSGSLLLVGGGRGGQSGLVALFDVATGERVITLGEEFDAVLAADISSDQQQVALGGPGKLIRVYSTKTGEIVHTIKKHTDWVTSLEFSPDAVLLASGDRSGGLHVWESFSGQLFYTLNGHKGAITDISWRSDSNVVASGSEDGTIWLWEMFNGTAVKSFAADTGVLSIDFTKDGRIASAGRDKVVKLWDGNGGVIRSFEALSDILTSVAFNHDASRIVTGDWTGEIRVFKTDDGVRLAQLSMSQPTIAARLEELAARIPALQQSNEQLQAALQSASQAQQAAQAAADAAKQSLAEAQGKFQSIETLRNDTQQKINGTSTSLASLTTDLEAKRVDAKTKADSLAAESAARDAIQVKLTTAEQAVAVEAKLVEQLASTAATARQTAQNGKVDAAKIEETAKIIDQAVNMAKEALAASQADQSAQATELTQKNQLIEQWTASSKAAADAIPPVEKQIADQTAQLQSLQAMIPDLDKQLADTKGLVDNLSGPSQAADQALANATTAANAAKLAADAASAALAQAKVDQKKWQIGQVRTTLFAAQKGVAEQEARHAPLSAKADEAKKLVDAAAAELAGVEKFLADGPSLIEQAKGVIAQAQSAIDAANAELEATKGILAKKEALRGDFETQMGTVKAAAEAEPTNEALAGAVLKANETLALLVADRDQAIKGVESKQANVQSAIDAKTNAEKSLADLEKKIADTPAQIELMKGKLAELTAAHLTHQQQADAILAEVNAAKQQVEQIHQQIAAMTAAPIP